MENYLATQVSAASPGLVLAWPDAPPSLDGASARLLLNLVLLAKDALPRGGRIRVETGAADGVKVVAHGEPAALSDEAKAVLHEGADPTGPRGAQAYLARLLAEKAGGRFNVSVTPDGLALAIGIGFPPSGG
jgi:histidine phosphotransferase ChpT